MKQPLELGRDDHRGVVLVPPRAQQADPTMGAVMKAIIRVSAAALQAPSTNAEGVCHRRRRRGLAFFGECARGEGE